MEFGDDPAFEADLIASIEHKLGLGMLTGFVIQGLVPYGIVTGPGAPQALHQGGVFGHSGLQGGARRARRVRRSA